MTNTRPEIYIQVNMYRPVLLKCMLIQLNYNHLIPYLQLVTEQEGMSPVYDSEY